MATPIRPYSSTMHRARTGLLDKYDWLVAYFNMAGITVKEILPGNSWDMLPDYLSLDSFEGIKGHPFLYKWLISPSMVAEVAAFRGVGSLFAKGKPFKDSLQSVATYITAGLPVDAALQKTLNVVVRDKVPGSWTGSNAFWYLSREYLKRELFFPVFDSGNLLGFKRLFTLEEAREADPSFYVPKFQIGATE